MKKWRNVDEETKQTKEVEKENNKKKQANRVLHEPRKKGNEIHAEEQMTSKAKEKAKGKERAGEGGTGG